MLFRKEQIRKEAFCFYAVQSVIEMGYIKHNWFDDNSINIGYPEAITVAKDAYDILTIRKEYTRKGSLDIYQGQTLTFESKVLLDMFELLIFGKYMIDSNKLINDEFRNALRLKMKSIDMIVYYDNPLNKMLSKNYHTLLNKFNLEDVLRVTKNKPYDIFMNWINTYVNKYKRVCLNDAFGYGPYFFLLDELVYTIKKSAKQKGYFADIKNEDEYRQGALTALYLFAEDMIFSGPRFALFGNLTEEGKLLFNFIEFILDNSVSLKYIDEIEKEEIINDIKNDIHWYFGSLR